jgi:CMP-N-acetylneuraminic acid synthetase
MKKIICIIPALEKNDYSTSGDLINWGGTSLIEWKLSQVKKVKKLDKIVVTTPSRKIKSVVKSYGVEVLLRKKNFSLSKLYEFVGKKYPNKKILWLNPTAPFLSEINISKFLEKFLKLPKRYDSAFTCIELKEFLFDKKKSINFNSLEKAISRKKVSKIFQSTNGAYIVDSNHMKKYGTLYGKKPYKYILPWLQSLEVKSTSELENFKFFISKYIKENI